MAEPQPRADGLTGEPLLLVPEEAAQVLRVGGTTLYALIKEGDLRPVHTGRSCRLSWSELERYVDRLEALAPAPSTRLIRRRRPTPKVRGRMDTGARYDARPASGGSCRLPRDELKRYVHGLQAPPPAPSIRARLRVRRQSSLSHGAGHR
jgi:excisionase family DNA binding protein